jgi:Peptidase family M50
MLSTMAYLAAQLALLAVLLLAITLVHEAGHAVAGLSCGFRIRSIRIGPLKASRDREHKWGVSFGIRRGGEVVAQLRAVPGKWGRLQCIAFILGGPFANFFIAIILWPLPLWSEAAESVAALFAIVSVAVGLINLIPFRTRFGMSDGAKLLSLLVGGAAKDEFLFRVSLLARVEEINAIRFTQPGEAVSKFEALIREAESLAKRRNKQDLAELAARFEKMIKRQGEPLDGTAQPDASPSSQPSAIPQES